MIHQPQFYPRGKLAASSELGHRDLAQFCLRDASPRYGPLMGTIFAVLTALYGVEKIQGGPDPKCSLRPQSHRRVETAKLFFEGLSMLTLFQVLPLFEPKGIIKETARNTSYCEQ